MCFLLVRQAEAIRSDGLCLSNKNEAECSQRGINGRGWDDLGKAEETVLFMSNF